MSKLSEIGEREIVASLIKKFDPKGNYSLGDDTAILDNGKEFLLMTTDTIFQKTHIPDNAEPEDVGWYAAAINLSDIAAMGGHPLGMLFSLGMPAGLSAKWFDRLTDGIRDCCAEFSVPVLGGDTKENDSITITGIALGSVPKSKILRRSGAKPGDILAMTGQLGRGILWERDNLISQYLKVEPRLKTGQQLAESGAITSCIDISDGLSTSVHLLAAASKSGFAVEENTIPYVPGLGEKEKMLALHYGGDFELLFTIRPDRADLVMNNTDCQITQIGYVTDDMSVSLVKGNASTPLENKGYEHFK